MAAKAETKRTARSDEVVLLEKWKSGVRALVKEEEKRARGEVEDRRDASSWSLRAWIACERRHSLRIPAIFSRRRSGGSSETARSSIGLVSIEREREKFWRNLSGKTIGLKMSK